MMSRNLESTKKAHLVLENSNQRYDARRAEVGQQTLTYTTVCSRGSPALCFVRERAAAGRCGNEAHCYVAIASLPGQLKKCVALVAVPPSKEPPSFFLAPTPSNYHGGLRWTSPP